MKVVAIIQARMGSTRLPGKVLRILKDRSVLGHVIERLKTVSNINQVVVATTTSAHDQIILDEASRYNVSVYRGSESDVLSRYYEAAIANQADIVVRVTSDCPLIDPEVVASVIQLLISMNSDYASNVLIRSFPRGLDVEAFTIDTLKKAYLNSVKLEHREHVTPYIYQNPHLFNIQNFVYERDYSKYRWTLDTIEDWVLIEEIYRSLYEPNKNFTWMEAVTLMEKRPELFEINAKVEQKKLAE